VAKVPLLHIEIMKRSDGMKGFVVLPRRYVVERTFSWFGRNRRLGKRLSSRHADDRLLCLQFAIIIAPGNPRPCRGQVRCR
jgi:transposase